MAFLDRFRRRRPEVRTEPRIEFLGEQDGPPERLLKASLAEELARVPRISAAYLARVGYQPQGQPGVALCIAGQRDDPALVDRLGQRFGAIFGSRAALDILFLTAEQEVEVRRVCTAFYPQAV
jgi:SseB protein C-terminal domain